LRQRRHGRCDISDTSKVQLDLPAPPVSVGLPVFNGADFLVQALESILAQTYTEFELIISDNASTDATPDIVRDYASRDTRIRYIRQAENIGIGNNWTFVAKQARGPLFKWMPANDLLAPTLLADCLKVLQDDPDVVLCYGRTQLIDMANNRLDAYGDDFEALSADPLERYRIVRRKLNLCTSILAGVVRLDALKRCGYMANYPHSDRVLIAGLALQGKLVLLPQILFYYRWGRTVATPLKTRLELTQSFRPGAKRPVAFVSLRRRVAQTGMAWRVPRGWGGKIRSVWTALRSTAWMGRRF
jgi:glycosyltransferase involved in cell wall biosynthesis